MKNGVQMESGSIIKESGVLRQIKDYYYKTGNNRDLLLFIMGINTGLKLNELLDLNVSDVRNKTYIELPASSWETPRRIPLNKESLGLIKKVISSRKDSAPLFESTLGRRIDRTTVYRNFKEVCLTLGLDSGITLASLRKTFGYHYYKTYGDLSTLQWLFNQNSILDTMKYIGLEEDMNEHFKVMEL